VKAVAGALIPILFAAQMLFGSSDLFAMARRPSESEDFPKLVEGWRYTVGDCYRLALRRMETVGIRQEDIETAKAQMFQAASEALGDIDFNMNAFHQDAPKPGTQASDTGGGSLAGTFAARHRRDREFTFNQPLFQGFKSVGAILGAGSLKGQRVEEKLRTQQLIFLDVSKAFYAVLKQKEEVEINKGIIVLFKERIAELEEREKIGRSRTSEVVNAQANMKTIEADLEQSYGKLANAEFTLEFLTGIPVKADQLADDSEGIDTVSELSDYLTLSEQLPSIKASEKAVKTALQGIIVAQSGLWPNLSLVHNQYVKREGFQSGFDWDLTLSADVPLFRGGENIGNIKEAYSFWKKAKLTYSLVKRQVNLQVKQAFQDWQTSKNRLRALAEAVEASEENYRLQNEDYSRSLVSNLDVLQALEVLHNNKRTANKVRYTLKENFRRLQVAAGEIPGDIE